MYKRWRVYSTFFTGLCIGLAYALLVGNPLSLGPADTILFIEWKVLVLAFSGILGGVIYTIVIDGEVEMPRFIVGQGALFKAGLFGDILLGIAGAFILELLLPASLSAMDAPSVDGSALAATGIIGGYGGRAIIKFSLERFFKYTGTLDEVRAAAMRQRLSPEGKGSQGRRVLGSTVSGSPVTRGLVLEDPVTSGSAPSDSISGDSALEDSTDDEHTLSLIDQLDRYIQEGLPARDWARLAQQLQAEPAAVHQAVFVALVGLRQEMAEHLNIALSEEQLQRMIELLNRLVGLSPNNPALYHQLALIHADLSPPAYGQALINLDKAIALRGPLAIGQSISQSIDQPWQYELHRAVINIEQGQATATDFTMPAAKQEAILKDLLTIAQVYNLDTILQAADRQQIPTPVVNWIRHNQVLLSEQEETRSLMTSLSSMIVGSPLRPINTESVPLTPKRPNTSESSTDGCSQMGSALNRLDTPTSPAPATNQSDLSNAHQAAVFPEIFSALARCYDILYLDPFNILGEKSAKATQVFDFYPHEAHPELDEKETILIPRGTRYTPGSSGKMQVSSQANLLYTESDVQKMFAGTLGATVTRLLGAVLPFSLSTSYASYKRERSAQKSVYAFTKAEYIHYTLALDRQQSLALHLNETFRQSVARLPLTATYEYLNFINDFGTHTATQVQFGGLFHHRYCLSQSAHAAIVQAGGNVSMEAKHAFEAKYENKREGSSFKEFSDSSEVFDFCGGMKQENIHDWFGTIKADPAPIHLELMPLYELLDSTFFSEDEQIIKKRSLLERATQTYLARNSQPPPWELWPSATVGGNGGEVFSDIDLTPVWLEANKERYETARVKEVRVWIKNWVERVQIVLEGEMSPLPGHGNEDGDLKILKLDADDYITAMSVRATSPQKIVIDRGTYIGSIRIQTHKQQDWVVGTPDARAIALDIPEGYQAIGFHGRCGKRIDKLGVISIPVTKQ